MRDGWADTEISPGDKVNIIGGENLRDPLTGIITLDSNQGLLVLNPDMLVSGTSVMASMRCTRQAFIQDQLAGDTSRAAVLGQLSHELLQTAVLGPESNNRVNGPQLALAISSVVGRNKDKVAEVGLSEDEARDQLSRHVHSFVAFHSTYLESSSPGGPIEMAPHSYPSEPTTCKINEIVDIEEVSLTLPQLILSPTPFCLYSEHLGAKVWSQGPDRCNNEGGGQIILLGILVTSRPF